MDNIETIFKTPAGVIWGWEDGPVLRATGIPYASAKRFGKPVAFPVFKDPFIAKSKSAAPFQTPSEMTNAVLGFDMLDGLAMDECCLNLSITMPKTIHERDHLPVMIWIYGGSYTTGAGDSDAYDPKYLVSEQEVIVVNINYRLGLLGFLGGNPGRPANLGLLDIISAVNWVKKNIQAFKGDPDNITVFGQSAGGDAVAHLLISDGMEGLIKRVIIQSAPLALSCKKQKMIAAMKEMSSEITSDTPLPAILEMQAAIVKKMKKFGQKGGMPFGVEYGESPLPQERDAAKVWKERARNTEVLIGCAANELALLTPFSKPLSLLENVPFIGKPLLRVLIKIYTNSIYIKPATKLARLLGSQREAPVYQYLITWGQENGYGPVHIIDIPLLFGDENTWKKSMLTRGIAWPEVLRDGRQVREVWGSFARTGRIADPLNLPGLLRCRRI